MDDVPAMPAVPAAGQEVDAMAVYRAVDICARRKEMEGTKTDALKQQHGEDTMDVIEIAVTAIVQRAPNQQQHPLAGLAGQAGLAAQLDQVLARLDQLQAGQAQLQAGQAQLLARQDNVRRRAQNLTAMAAAAQGLVVLLQPLGKERQPAVAGGAAVGAEPPGDAFPATLAALDRLTGQQLTTLANFYDEVFAGNNVREQREAFKRFICT